jgi:uncharacterized RDD family membrane protein YckC
MTEPRFQGPYPPAQQQAYYPPQAYGQVSSPPGNALQPYPAWPSHAPAVYAPAPQWPARPAFQLVSAGGRLGAVLVDGLLIVVTFGIGWLIWAMITWCNGQTPGRQLLGHVVADANTGEAFGWGRMFLREFLIKGLLFWIPNAITFGLFGLVDSLLVFRADGRTLHDMIAGSIVRHR